MDVQRFPKVELHCHLDGILDRPMLREIHAEDPDFPVDPAQFEAAYPVNSFESFVRWYEFIRPIERSLEPSYPILERHFRRLKRESVVYSEIMITGGQLPDDPRASVEKVAALRRWADEHEEQNFQVEFLLAVGRQKTPQRFAQLADRTIALFEAGLIAGFAIAGPEEGNPIRPFQTTMNRLHDAGIPIEIHAGEWCGPESVRDALRYGHPLRIGHGVSLFADPELLQEVIERKIHIEMCPTSNLKTMSVSRIEDHPMKRAAELGMSFSINTDDPGPFECSMASEYELVANAFGFDEATFHSIFQNSLNARFRRVPRIAAEEEI